MLIIFGTPNPTSRLKIEVWNSRYWLWIHLHSDIMALPLIPRTGTSCPLIYLKKALEFFALIFFAAAFGICLDLAYYFYLKGGFDADNFQNSQSQRDVFISASIFYAVLTICSFVASLFTCHLLSDDIKDDDYCFKQLWKLLGLDKKKTPLPSPFDEEPKQDENAYLQPIVHFEGPGISGKSQQERLKNQLLPQCSHLSITQFNIFQKTWTTVKLSLKKFQTMWT